MIISCCNIRFITHDHSFLCRNCDTLTHLLKASLGSGILSMPLAFKYSGLAMGIVYTVIVAIICTHCAYILVSKKKKYISITKHESIVTCTQ